MATAKKLPSGSWRVNQYVGKDEDGKRIYKSFTADTKKEAEYLAAEFMIDYNLAISVPTKRITVKEAMENMIELKKPTISPSTYRNYLQIFNGGYFDLVADKQVQDLNDKLVQKMINSWVEKDLSPKTIRNLHSMFLSTIKTVDKRLTFDVRLPQKYQPDIYIPTEDEVKLLVQESKGTLLELPVLLAAYMGLRRSEIVALEWKSVDMKKKRLQVNSATVIGADNNVYTKQPKSVAGKRYVDIPTVVMEAMKRHKTDDPIHVVPLTGSAIFNRFRKLQKKLNMPEFRFHDLRHYNASIMLALGVPDKYAMQRIGHSSNAILKNVYQHIMDDKQREFSKTLDEYFSAHT